KRIAEFLNAQRANAKDPEGPTLALAADGTDPAKNEKNLELAAWTVTCRALLNLDETITKG
ncbi:MAG TPA: hypothetical protein PLJ47_14600, partial [Candidatus Hydrogenedentes bacterium]|nr:hypothetical protein [Candidatus Hydrogenedentota bacterium]